MANVVEFTDSNFESEVLSSEVPVLVDFTAVWCGPCKAIAPTIEKLAGEYEGRIKIGKLDIDNNPGVPTKYHVRAVPTLMLFQGGQVKDQLMGAANKKKIEGMFNSVM